MKNQILIRAKLTFLVFLFMAFVFWIVGHPIVLALKMAALAVAFFWGIGLFLILVGYVISENGSLTK